jgi:hypothetical protein
VGTAVSEDSYCVLCGAIYDGKNGVDLCKKSSANLSHLWARVGYVEDWFPVKRVRDGDGTLRSP